MLFTSALSILFGSFIATGNAMKCIPLSGSSCGCELEDGSAKIDLTSMTVGHDAPMFTLKHQGYTYQVDMCRSFSCDSKDSRVCITDSIIPPSFVRAGNDISYDYNEETKVPTFIYTQTTQTTSTRIVLHCDYHADGLGTLSQFEKLDMEYTTSLNSKYACFKYRDNIDGGLSNGSIICIVLLVLVVVYIVGGILVNKYVRKVEGDIFPNKEMWKDFPSKIKGDWFKATYSTLVFLTSFCTIMMVAYLPMERSEEMSIIKFEQNDSV